MSSFSLAILAALFFCVCKGKRGRDATLIMYEDSSSSDDEHHKKKKEEKKEKKERRTRGMNLEEGQELLIKEKIVEKPRAGGAAAQVRYETVQQPQVRYETVQQVQQVQQVEVPQVTYQYGAAAATGGAAVTGYAQQQLIQQGGVAAYEVAGGSVGGVQVAGGSVGGVQVA